MKRLIAALSTGLMSLGAMAADMAVTAEEVHACCR